MNDNGAAHTNWPFVPLGECSTIHPGQHILENAYNRRRKGIPYLTGPADFGEIAPIICRWTDSPKAWALPGDVLVTVKGAGVGKTNLAPGFKVAIGRQLMAVRPSNGLNQRYLFYFFRRVFERFQQAALGATVPGLGRDDIESLEIPLPPLAEQERIAARLTEQLAAVESARAAAQARLAAAEALPGAYLREVFEGPEASEWEMTRLSEICSVVEGQVDPREPEYANLPHVNGENIESGTGRILETKSAAEDGLISGKYLFEPGMVLYSKLRPYLRKVAVAPFRGVCSADMYPITFDAARADSQFALWSLLAGPFTRYAVKKSERARMPKLNRDQLYGWEMPLPPLEKQRSIAVDLAARLAEAGRLTTILRDELAAIDALPAALLREAFNGQN
jgi:type I restriction enzyme S subunit